MAPIPEYRPSLHTTHVLPMSISPGKHATQTGEPAPDALPAPHAVHSESPPLAANVPPRQLMHTLAEIWATRAEYLPGEQLLHCESAVAPWALEYFPLSHGLHVSVVCSATSLYLPASQAVHDA